MADHLPEESGNTSFPRGPDFEDDQPTQKAELLLFRRYRVIRELGRGAMGVVVLAHDTALDVPVAVKLVPELVARDIEAIADLRKEVLRGMALTHPAIVRTHNFEKDETGAGIVMEYVEGDDWHTLKARQPGGCFEGDEILPWIEQLCDVLDYAHRQARIVHRDLKPRNVMIAKDGRLKVADFGIAAALTDTVSRHSMEGRISGTLSYMSPQQAEGKKPSHLDDIHALGATIYDLLTGKPPFFRGSPASVHAQIITAIPPSLTERREELEVTGRAPIPPHWETTLAACLAKDPAERPQSAGEVLARLRSPTPALPEIATVAPAEAPPTLRARRRFGLAATIVALVIALIAGIALFPPGKPSGVVSTPPAVPAPGTPTPETAPAETPPTPPLPISTPIAVETAPPPAPELVEPTFPARDPIVNSLGMKFVPVPRSPLLFSVWETRVQDYQVFARATGREWTKPEFKQGPTHPAVMVSWEDASAFCLWLSKKEGRKYRLPTDAEWSIAAGLGKERPGAPFAKDGLLPGYPWGPAWPPPKQAGNYADAAAERASAGYGYIDSYDDGYAYTSPVGSFTANAAGLHDLGGNVWEWCEEWLNPDKREERVLRGCSWYDGAELYMRSSARYGVHHSFRMDFNGFRCVLE